MIAAGVRPAAARCRRSPAAGYGTRTAIEYAREAERLGADGLLLLPPYSRGSQEGLRAHITAICNSTRLGVIVYNRANCRLTADTVARLAADCSNLIGFKDGVGDIEQLTGVRNALGDRLLFINGMPTAETYARSFRGIGIPGLLVGDFQFSSAHRVGVPPRHQRRRRSDGRLLAEGDFFIPYVAHPQSRRRLCGQHREGRCDDRWPQRRPGAAAVVGLHDGGGGGVAEIDRGDGTAGLASEANLTRSPRRRVPAGWAELPTAWP